MRRPTPLRSRPASVASDDVPTLHEERSHDDGPLCEGEWDGEACEVVCPRQGVVDLELCWVCPAYGGLSGGRLQGVVCTMNLADLRIGPQPTIR